MSARRGDGQRGTSLIEMMFVVAITGFALTAVVAYSFRARTGLSRQEVAADLFSTNARIGSNIRADLQSANLLMVNYGPGGVDFSALDGLVRNSIKASPTGAPAMVNFSMEPTASPMAEPDLTDTASAQWGNELIYLANLGPVSFTARDAGSCSTCPVETVAVIRYQFVCVYLTQTNVPSGSGSGTLRLVQWRSQPVVDLDSAQETATGGNLPRMTATAAALVALGYNYAFSTANANLTATANAFYRITATSPYYANGSANAPATLGESSWAYLDDYDYTQRYSVSPGKDYGRISRSGYFGGVAMPYTLSVAYDTVNPLVNPSMKVNKLEGPGGLLQVPLYALADNPAAVWNGAGGGAGFPGGFEVAVVGSALAREVYIRRVLMANSGNEPNAGPKVFQAQEAIDDVALHSPY